MIQAGHWNADRTAQCVDVNKTGSNVARVTVRSDATGMTTRYDDGVALAKRAAPDSGLAVMAELYTQFASQGYTYMTFVITWR